jgi:hypothetical protein
MNGWSIKVSVVNQAFKVIILSFEFGIFSLDFN